jgi:opacity protein-like surface antigen
MCFIDDFTKTKQMGDNMKKTLLLLTLLAVAGMAPASAQAAKHYVSGFGGISWMNNMDATQTYISANGEDYSSNTDLGSGMALTGAIGCDYGNYRLEAEVGYQTNDAKSLGSVHNGVVDTWPTNALGTTETTRQALKGDVSVLSLMGNGYYDFDLGSKVELYATAGIGVAQVSFHDVTNATDINGSGSENSPYVFSANPDPGFNAHETTLAWQVGAGLAAPIADNVKLDLRYRYFATTDFTVADMGDHSNSHTNSMNTNLSSHSVLLGLRVDF